MAEQGRAKAMNGLRWQVLAFIAAVAAAGAAIVVMACIRWDDEELGLLATLAAFAAVAERFDVRLFKDSRVSVSTVPMLAAGMIAGLPGIMVVALVAALADYIGRDKPYYKAVFNAGALLLSGAAFVAVFEAFPVGNDSGEWPALVFPTLMGVLATFIVNSALVACVITLDTGVGLVSIWNDNFRALPPSYVIFGVLAAVMASAYQMDGLSTMAVIFVPLAMMASLLKASVERAVETLVRLREDKRAVVPARNPGRS